MSPSGERRRVTLTFDNGPAAGVTGQVLDVLGERGVKATFFAVGAQVQRPGGRTLLEQAAADGHWIGNHSLTHAVPLGDDPDPAAPSREIDGAQALLGDLAHPDRLFRPFGGGGRLDRHLLSAAAVDHLARGGYSLALWSSVPRDWERPDTWVDAAMDDVHRQKWAVVVLHDLPTGAMRVLPEFLDRLHDEEVEIVQAFPDACLPMRRGTLRASLAGLVA